MQLLRNVKDLSSWTILIFGAMALILGIVGILNPDILLTMLGFEVVDRTARASADYTTVFVTASSMASLNMGVYYVLAALNNMRKFYTWTVPFRVLTFTVFTLAVLTGTAPGRFFAVAVWELIGALATGFALYRERRLAQ